MRTSCLAAFVLLVAPAVSAQSTTLRSVIRTSAKASVPVSPTRVSVAVGVSTRARWSSDAGRANAQVLNNVRAAVRALGVPEDSITTLGYNVQMTTNQSGTDTAFVATNTVLVRLREMSLIGRVIDTALAAGATGLNGVTYTVDNADGVTRKALALAVSEARLKAEIMAKASGGRLGRLIVLTTEQTAFGWPGFEEASVTTGGSSAEFSGTTITPGPMTAGAWVSGQWEFVPSRRT